MATRKTLGAIALTASIAAGGIAGATLGIPGISGAQSDPTTTTTAPSDPAAGDHQGGPRGFRAGAELDAAAKALGMTTEELRTALDGTKTIADIAAEKGVDKQTVIDAMVAAGEAKLDEQKAALPDRMAEAVESTRIGRGPGERGGRGGPGWDRGVGLDAAATALGMTKDELRTALGTDKSIADIAAEKGVDKQTVIDALVKAATERLDKAVTDGKMTQADADERKADLTTRITEAIDEKGAARRGGPGGRHGGPDMDGAAPGDAAPGDTTTTAPSDGGN